MFWIITGFISVVAIITIALIWVADFIITWPFEE